MTPSPALLDCLDAVWRLRQDATPVSVRRLARRLGLEEAVARERLYALRGLGLVDADAQGRASLTPAGERTAVGLVRKHRLLERFLTDLLKLPWERVHEEACRLTPVLSDDVAEGLANLLAHPEQCPHGNPIPSAHAAVIEPAGTPLDRLRPGEGGVIQSVTREEPETLKYLAALGLLPDATVEVEEIAPFGGPVLVRVSGSRYALGRKVAAGILVRTR